MQVRACIPAAQKSEGILVTDASLGVRGAGVGLRIAPMEPMKIHWRRHRTARTTCRSGVGGCRDCGGDICRGMSAGVLDAIREQRRQLTRLHHSTKGVQQCHAKSTPDQLPDQCQVVSLSAGGPVAALIKA